MNSAFRPIEYLVSRFNSLYAEIYNIVILHMTTAWYRVVLLRIDEDENDQSSLLKCKSSNGIKRPHVMLDVGIGTAGALLRCCDIMNERNKSTTVSKQRPLSIVGIDYDRAYVSAAKEAIDQALLMGKLLRQHSNYNTRDSMNNPGKNDLRLPINVFFNSVYDVQSLQDLAGRFGTFELCEKQTVDSKPMYRNYFDSVYFSGSLSLMPDPLDALLSSASVVKPSGYVYVTQTYQHKIDGYFGSLLNSIIVFIKPMVKFLTTIDFGRLVMEDEILTKVFSKVDELELVEHRLISGSINNYFQGAYLTVLRKKTQHVT
mmetsp:Transcript_39139/g.91189  ORF Transcript_39139/g.91189 Transcript_39139/m.91189 type:complete len:316 (-) Transcript_39139:464-1411(-)